MLPQIKTLAEYYEQYKLSVEDPQKFWGGIGEHFHWQKKWDKVLEWNFNEPKIAWYEGAKIEYY